MASDKADQLFWKAYAAAIKTNVGAKVGQTSAFYLASKAQRGPPGGDNITPTYTNQGIYQIGNNLLPPDDLFYNPSSSNSYIDQLRTYLAWVDVGGNPDPALIGQVTNTRDDMDAAQIGRDRQLQKAFAEYGKAITYGLVGTQTFAQWVPGNAPAFILADKEWKNKAAAYQKIFKMVYGALGDMKLDDEAKLNKAVDETTTFEGYNMACAIGTPPSAREIDNAKNAGNALPVPPAVLRPAFNCPDYISQIKDAQMMAGTDKPPAHELIITTSKGKDVKEKDFNESKASGEVGFTYVPWLSVSANASHAEQSEAIKTESEMEDIIISIFYDDMKLVSIAPSGSWDINVRGRYKGLLPGAPTSIKTLVKPTQLLLATRLGYKVKLGEKITSTFDTKYKETVSGGGSISVFGIPCKLGAQFQKGTENDTHRLEWDADNREFTVMPTNNCGFATIVGVMGEKIVVSA